MFLIVLTAPSNQKRVFFQKGETAKVAPSPSKTALSPAEASKREAEVKREKERSLYLSGYCSVSEDVQDRE